MHLPIHDELTQELTEIKYKTNSNGSIQIESNDDIKLRLGRSPDLAVSVALTYWEGDGSVGEGKVYT